VPLKTVVESATWTLICTVIGVLPLQAQDHQSEPPSRRLNSNLAFTLTAPLDPTVRYATALGGLTYGVGYNFNRRHSVLAEVMWNGLSPTSQALAPIRAATQNNDLNGHGNLVALTANYRLQVERKVFGTYFIAGAGAYYRNATLSQFVAAGESVSCSPAWLWWGFMCESGTVTSHQTLASSSSTAPGANAGIGFTVRIPDSQYKFYVESRYHYAASKGVATHVIPITVGVRF
jgi:Outer membrane protein beta-barrel domain